MFLDKSICIINNFNYAHYLKDCLSSVFNQTKKFDKVVVVDDGSTDNSAQVIEEFKKEYPYLIPVYKENGGQLSCFNRAIDFVDNDSRVFLLDSDDIYPPDYLQLIYEKLLTINTDFIFTSAYSFSNNNEIPKSAKLNNQSDLLYKKTSALVRMARGVRGTWIGNITSSLSLRGSSLKQILPYPFEENWKTRADDIIIFGASILGLEKLFIPSISVGYRKHANSDSTLNEYTNLTPIKEKARQENLQQLINFYCEKFNLPIDPNFKEVLSEYDNLGSAKNMLLKDGFRLFI